MMKKSELALFLDKLTFSCSDFANEIKKLEQTGNKLETNFCWNF